MKDKLDLIIVAALAVIVIVVLNLSDGGDGDGGGGGSDVITFRNYNPLTHGSYDATQEDIIYFYDDAGIEYSYDANDIDCYVFDACYDIDGYDMGEEYIWE